MSFGSVVVAIVAIVAFAVMRIVKYQSGAARPPTPATAYRQNELEREIVDLKKRLAVLERLVTDDRQSQAIAHEIEALRDQ